METKELVVSTLEKMGYRPILDKDGDIMIRYQMKVVFVMVYDEEHDSFISVMLPQFYKMEDGEETLVLATCNKMTRNMKMVKTYVEEDYTSVTAACHFFHTNEEALERSLGHALRILGTMRTRFREKLEEMRKLAG